MDSVKYMIENSATGKQAEMEFGISKGMVHIVVTK